MHHSKETDRPDDKTIAAQLRKPEGQLGLRVGEKMNETNLFITELTYTTMAANPADQILEIGFGNGKFLSKLLDKLPEGSLTGLDHSPDMVEAATIINADAIKSGKLSLVHGSITAMPFTDSIFDHVCTINTLYFWTDPLQELQAIRRVLRPGGHLTIAIRTKQSMKSLSFTEYGFTTYDQGELELLLGSCGFDSLTFGVYSEPDGKLESLIVSARRSV